MSDSVDRFPTLEECYTRETLNREAWQTSCETQVLQISLNEARVN